MKQAALDLDLPLPERRAPTCTRCGHDLTPAPPGIRAAGVCTPCVMADDARRRAAQWKAERLASGGHVRHSGIAAADVAAIIQALDKQDATP